ncbi:MAG: amidohydrolase family protein [Pirellulales bacterium]
MSRSLFSSRLFRTLMLTAMLCPIAVVPADDVQENAQQNAKENAKPKWDSAAPPGEKFEQKIDVDEGTWISLDVSPDGKEIVFDLLGDIYIMPIGGADGTGGKRPAKLTVGIAWDMQPRFSPDGKWIAFTSDRAGKSEKAGDNIWIMRRDGTDAKQVTNETFTLLNGPAWSPDGEYIVARKHFTGRRSLGSGEMWLYHRSAIDVGSTAGIQLTKRPNDQKDVNEPIFSRDGRYLFYSQDATPGDSFEYDKDSNKQIYVVKRLDLKKGTTENYITGPGGACRPVPSPDGKSLAFVRRVGAKTGLHILDCESGSIRLVYDALERDMQEAWAIHGVYPAYAWTPDGAHIIAWAKGKIRRISVADGSAEIIPFKIEDKREMRKAVRFPVDAAPKNFPVKMLRWVQVSPSGDRVVFQALGHIYVKSLSGGKPQRLTSQSEHFEFMPSFSPDGKHIVYTTWHDEKLGSVRVASSNPSDGESWKVTSQPGHYLEPVFSPDGSRIVYRKSSDGYLRSPLWSREPGLYSIEARGGEPIKLHEGGSNPQFGADGSRVFFVDRNSSKDADNLVLMSIGMDGKEMRQHCNSRWGTDYRVSPDGKWIAFIERFNVYLVPLLQTGGSVDVGPGSASLPTAKMSSESGDFVHFSGDSRTLYWTVGPTLYSQSLEEAFPFLKKDSTSEAAASGASGLNPSNTSKTTSGDKENAQVTSADVAKDAAKPQKVEPKKIDIGFEESYTAPVGVTVLVGAKIVTMSKAGTIENGVIVVEGNRIKAVGSKSEVTIPDGAHIVQTPGLVVMPGLIDAHAHGAMDTEGITPQANWGNYCRLAFGVTTIHDPSNDTQGIFSASEMVKAGVITGPRVFSTGTILYGAAGSYKAEIESVEDAKFHLQRMKAVGAISVKSYNQPRRDQRQQVIAAARELQMMVVPEGGSTFMHNMTMIVDGHTGIEHTLSVQTAYDDVMDLWRGTEVGYTPTLCVAYGGISGERYWYQQDDLWLHPRLNAFMPKTILHPKSRRREKAPLEDYNHMRVAEIAKQVVEQGGLAQTGGHGQLIGMDTHWELWSLVQGGMSNLDSLRCGTILGARYLGLDKDLGSIEPGKLADLIVIERGHDPTKDIRDSQAIAMVMANGRLFDAPTMKEIGGRNEPAPKFFFHAADQQAGGSLPSIRGCDCCRPGGLPDWMINP